MNPYADADRAHEEKMSRDEAVFRIFGRMMSDRDIVRQAIADTRNKYPRAKKGGEFGGLVEQVIVDMASQEYDASRCNRKYRNGEW